jgi:hypothetical protein
MLSRKSKNYISYEFAATFDDETQYLQGFSHKKYHFHALLRINLNRLKERKTPPSPSSCEMQRK